MNLSSRHQHSNFGLLNFNRFPSERHCDTPTDGAAQRCIQCGSDVWPMQDHVMQLYLRSWGQVVCSCRGALPLPDTQCRPLNTLLLSPRHPLLWVSCHYHFMQHALSLGKLFLALLLVTDCANVHSQLQSAVWIDWGSKLQNVLW